MNNPIGGYFELELNSGVEYHKSAIRLNTGRNALEYILRSRKYKKVFIPYYTCDVMLEPIKNLSLDYSYYHINNNFMPVVDNKEMAEFTVLLYTNYFGLCDSQVFEVVRNFNSIIVDNSQAFFSMPVKNVDTFYSPRKFFGVPDGAYLYTSSKYEEEYVQDYSYNRFEHLIRRIDVSPEDAYRYFKKNDDLLSGQQIRTMSRITRAILKSVNYSKVAKKRKNNFRKIANSLDAINLIELPLGEKSVPLFYPFLHENGEDIKRYLIRKKVFIPTYWPNMRKNKDNHSPFENILLNKLVPIPIDQRYSLNDMIKIIRYIKHALDTLNEY